MPQTWQSVLLLCDALGMKTAGTNDNIIILLKTYYNHTDIHPYVTLQYISNEYAY